MEVGVKKYSRSEFHGNKLDRKIIINIPTIAIDADTKYQTITWGADIEVFASVVHNNASKESEIMGGVIYDDIITAIIRYKSEYDNTDIKVQYKNKSFDVVQAREAYGRRQWLILKCVYGGKELNV